MVGLVVIIFFSGISIGAIMLIYALWLGTAVSAKAGWQLAGRGVLVALGSVIAAAVLLILRWSFPALVFHLSE